MYENRPVSSQSLKNTVSEEITTTEAKNQINTLIVTESNVTKLGLIRHSNQNVE